VNVSLTMSFSPPGLTLPLGGRPARPLLTLSAPAPAGGLVVTLSSGNPAVAAVPASVFVPENSLSVAVQVSPLTPGITTIRARVSSFVPEAALTVAVNP
jgi:hypothetical protein